MKKTNLAFPSGSINDAIVGSVLTKVEYFYAKAISGVLSNKGTGTAYSSAALTLPTNLTASIKKFVDKVVTDLGKSFKGTMPIMQSNTATDAVNGATLSKYEFFIGEAISTVMADASNVNAMSTILSDTIVANMSTTVIALADAIFTTVG